MMLTKLYFSLYELQISMSLLLQYQFRNIKNIEVLKLYGIIHMVIY